MATPLRVTRSQRSRPLITTSIGTGANRLASIRLLTWLEQEIQILMLEHVQSAVQAFGFAWYLREPCLKIHNGFLSGRSYQDLVLKGEIL